MAKIINTESQAETVTTVTEVVTQGATIFLSQDELNTLHTILRYIGGSPDYSPRKHADSILNAIRCISVPLDSTCIDSRERRIIFN